MSYNNPQKANITPFITSNNSGHLTGGGAYGSYSGQSTTVSGNFFKKPGSTSFSGGIEKNISPSTSFGAQGSVDTHGHSTFSVNLSFKY
ncbi:MAG: hypothetical protein WCW01_05740 [Gammaproteobacteria bacterium]|jgi:hypothetical protein